MLVPHLAGMATQIQDMWQRKIIWAGERNVLSDALLAAAASGPADMQSKVCILSQLLALHGVILCPLCHSCSRLEALSVTAASASVTVGTA